MIITTALRYQDPFTRNRTLQKHPSFSKRGSDSSVTEPVLSRRKLIRMVDDEVIVNDPQAANVFRA